MTIGDPLPAAPHLHGMAEEMARPVSHGLLPMESALAACIVATLHAERNAGLGRYKAADVFRHQKFLLAEKVHKLAALREETKMRIRRLLRPLIAIREKSNVLLAEAHGVNGEAGFPFTEGQVADIVTIEIWRALPTGERPRHVR